MNVLAFVLLCALLVAPGQASLWNFVARSAAWLANRFLTPGPKPIVIQLINASGSHRLQQVQKQNTNVAIGNSDDQHQIPARPIRQGISISRFGFVSADPVKPLDWTHAIAARHESSQRITAIIADDVPSKPASVAQIDTAPDEIIELFVTTEMSTSEVITKGAQEEEKEKQQQQQQNVSPILQALRAT